MFEVGQRYKIFYRPGLAVPVEGYDGSDPSKYLAIGTFAGTNRSNSPIRFLFLDMDVLDLDTLEYFHIDDNLLDEDSFSESSGNYKAVKVNPESGLPMDGGRRRRRTTRRQKRKASRSKRGSRKQ